MPHPLRHCVQPAAQMDEGTGHTSAAALTSIAYGDAELSYGVVRGSSAGGLAQLDTLSAIAAATIYGDALSPQSQPNSSRAPLAVPAPTDALPALHNRRDRLLGGAPPFSYHQQQPSGDGQFASPRTDADPLSSRAAFQRAPPAAAGLPPRARSYSPARPVTSSSGGAPAAKGSVHERDAGNTNRSVLVTAGGRGTAAARSAVLPSASIGTGSGFAGINSAAAAAAAGGGATAAQLAAKVRSQSQELADLTLRMEASSEYTHTLERRLLEISPDHPIPVSSDHLGLPVTSLSRLAAAPSQQCECVERYLV